MSGKKCSPTSFDRRGEIILNIRSTREDLLRKAGFLEKQIEDLGTRVHKEKVSAKNKSLIDVLSNYLNTLNDITEEIESKEKTLDGFPVRNRASIDELEKDQGRLLKESEYMKRIANNLNTINSKISEIIEIDNVISRIEADFSEIESLMKSNSSLLQEWSPREYGELVRESDVLKERFSKYLTNIGSGKIDSINLLPIKEVYRGLRDHINKVEGMVTNYTVKDKEVKAIKNRIEKLRQNVNEQAISAKGPVIKSLLNEYLNRLKIGEAELEKKKYEGMSEMLDGLSHNLPLLEKVDEINYGIETEMSKIDSIFKENDAIFKKWVPKDYEDYLNIKGGIAAKLGEFKKELGGGVDIAKFDSLLAQSGSLSDKVSSSLSMAIEKDKLHQKRLYVIKSLREVCASLGFQEVDDPHYSEKDNPYSPVIQTFDTLNLGTITFTVALEGKLESSSRISIDHCDEEFSKFSEVLKDQFGIETFLQRIEESEPIKKYKTAKDLPTSAGKLSQGK
jgi:hypothetical protein